MTRRLKAKLSKAQAPGHSQEVEDRSWGDICWLCCVYPPKVSLKVLPSRSHGSLTKTFKNHPWKVMERTHALASSSPLLRRPATLDVTETLFAYQHIDHLEEGMTTTPVSSPREPHGQRSPEGYSPWGRDESDRTGVAGPTRMHDSSS